MSLRKRFPDAADFRGRMKARTVKVRLPPVVQQQAFRFSEQRMEMEPISCTYYQPIGLSGFFLDGYLDCAYPSTWLGFLPSLLTVPWES
ncbi:hypothetical protein QYF36_002392 [Acer negundo]|nr:hypothetical protein QYF36_002392 [Acer negundo]